MESERRNAIPEGFGVRVTRRHVSITKKQETLSEVGQSIRTIGDAFAKGLLHFEFCIIGYRESNGEYHEFKAGSHKRGSEHNG